MSVNYEAAKREIGKVLEQIGDKHAWRHASFHLRAAMRIIDEIANKESRKVDKVEPQNWVLKNGKMMSPSEAKKAIKKIDSLIELESEKIRGRSDDQSADDQSADDTTLID